MIPDHCPYCGSKSLAKAGTRMTVRHGKIHRFQCTNCGHYTKEWFKQEYHFGDYEVIEV